MTPKSKPVIALVNATTAAMPATAEAFASVFPEAQLWNLLDDRLLEEANAQGGLTIELEARMARLIRHAALEGADGVLLTCSMYGPVAHKVSAEFGIPIYGADDAAFDAALSGEFRTILLVASLETSLLDAKARLADASWLAGRKVDVTATVAQGAAEAASAGATPALVDALETAVRGALVEVEAVLLAQYSLALAAEELEKRLGIPVLAGPRRAAAVLRNDILPTGGS